MNEGERISAKKIPDLDHLQRRLYETLRVRPGLRVALFGYTYPAARLVNEFFSLLGGRFVPVCIIDNRRAGEPGPVKACPVVSFDEARDLAANIDLIAVMIDGPSLSEVLGQITDSSLRGKEILFVHRDHDPLAGREFAALAAQATEALHKRGVVWYTDERNWYSLYQFMQQTAALEGDVAEFGVFQGGSAWFLARLMGHFGLDEKLLFLYDTFAGIPESSSLDLVDVNDFSGNSAERVTQLMSGFPNARIVPGDIKQTFSGSNEGPFSLVHVDCDQYEVTRFLCEQLYPRMTPGGVMLFQNYAFGATLGERIAVDGFFKDKPEAVLTGFDGAAFVVRHPCD